MSVFSISLIAIVCVVAILFLRKYNLELSYVTALAGSVIILIILIPQIISVIKYFTEIVNKTGLSKQIFITILKAVGISIITQLTIDVCNDFGQRGIAAKVELACRLIILIMTFPYILEIINFAVNLVN